MKTKSGVKDFSREGINLDKIIQAFRLLLPRNTKTLIKLKKFSELDLGKIKNEKGVEIKGLILDVDGCMTFNHQKILPENLEHLKKLINKAKIVIYSNMKWSKRYEILPAGIRVLTNIAAKPSLKGFHKAISELNLSPKNIAMVGDNYLTDGGAIRADIHFIHVKPLINKNRGFLEFIHDLISSFLLGIAGIHDYFRSLNGGR